MSSSEKHISQNENFPADKQVSGDRIPNKVFGIAAPRYWKLKLWIILGISFGGIAIRRILDFPLSIDWEWFIVPLSVFLLYAYWELFFRINTYLNRVMPFEENLFKRITVQLLIGACIILVTRQSFLYFFNDWVGFEFNQFHYFLLIATDTFFSFVINLGFISDYFIRAWKENLLKTERLEKEKSHLRYQQLKNQVNPHMLFNSLSALDSLIQSDRDLASKFVRHLSTVYRYVLQHKESSVVDLATELAFIENYKELFKLRFGDAFQLDLNVSKEAKGRGIVMITLQMLIDNAIKHNEIHPRKPLIINIYDEDGVLVIKNNIQKKENILYSGKQGLVQLKELYAIISSEEVTIMDAGDYFMVKIPLL